MRVLAFFFEKNFGYTWLHFFRMKQPAWWDPFYNRPQYYRNNNIVYLYIWIHRTVSCGYLKMPFASCYVLTTHQWNFHCAFGNESTAGWFLGLYLCVFYTHNLLTDVYMVHIISSGEVVKRMKQKDLVKKLESIGFCFERHCGNHDIYTRQFIRLFLRQLKIAFW